MQCFIGYLFNFTLVIILMVLSSGDSIEIHIMSTSDNPSSPILVSFPTTTPSRTIEEAEAEQEQEEDLPNNAPLRSCGSAGGVEDGQYITVQKQYMDPVCEDVQGYCRLRRNQNYTAILRFTPKVEVQSLTVRVTGVHSAFGVERETLFWPEYGICSRFNLTCPQEPDVTVQAHNHDEVPEKVPPTRGVFRLRLLGTMTGDETKKPYLCRQLALQLY